MSQVKERRPKCKIKQPKPLKWLVMIYLAGNNNLSANCIDILQELEAAFECFPQYADEVRVLACFDANTPRPRGARYFEINFRRKYASNSPLKWELHNDLVPIKCLPGPPVETPDFCCDDTSSPPPPPMSGPVAREGLSRFIRFARDHHKNAQRHMLILFGHGSAVAGNTFLAGNTPPSFLRLKELKEVLARHFDARKQPLSEVDEAENDDVPDEKLTAAELAEKGERVPLDILACDNCMMNGIESAFEIRRRVKYIIGSQGLVLALGWPFRRVIEEVLKGRDSKSEDLAKGILKVCARNLLDYALMDRSSEQSLCDLTTLRKPGNLVTAVRHLSRALQDGLKPDPQDGVNTFIRDAIRMARLEAQSYWSETFVDLYDFCLLLIERCNEFKALEFDLRRKFSISEEAAELAASDFIERFGAIAHACNEVLNVLKGRRPFVLCSYYIGPELQYSNGVSIYFPWTMPEAPIIFEQDDDVRGGGTYGLSWASVERARDRIERRMLAEARDPSIKKERPNDYKLVSAFDEYRTYEFATCYGGDWAAFLTSFFKATLRNVRRFNVKYGKPENEREFLKIKRLKEQPFFNVPIDLQKSSSDVDSETDCPCPTIKNYPRRFYLSPEDCPDVCPDDPHGGGSTGGGSGSADKGNKPPRKPCVSYLGWNIRGIVAEVIHMPKPKPPRGGPRRS